MNGIEIDCSRIRCEDSWEIFDSSVVKEAILATSTNLIFLLSLLVLFCL